MKNNIHIFKVLSVEYHLKDCKLHNDQPIIIYYNGINMENTIKTTTNPLLYVTITY